MQIINLQLKQKHGIITDKPISILFEKNLITILNLQLIKATSDSNFILSKGSEVVIELKNKINGFKTKITGTKTDLNNGLVSFELNENVLENLGMFSVVLNIFEEVNGKIDATQTFNNFNFTVVDSEIIQKTPEEGINLDAVLKLANENKALAVLNAEIITGIKAKLDRTNRVMTDAEIKTAYENNTSTNAFTDFFKTQLETCFNHKNEATVNGLEVKNTRMTLRSNVGEPSEIVSPLKWRLGHLNINDEELTLKNTGTGGITLDSKEGINAVVNNEKCVVVVARTPEGEDKWNHGDNLVWNAKYNQWVGKTPGADGGSASAGMVTYSDKDIKKSYERNKDTNAFTDKEKSSLNTIMKATDGFAFDVSKQETYIKHNISLTGNQTLDLDPAKLNADTRLITVKNTVGMVNKLQNDLKTGFINVDGKVPLDEKLKIGKGKEDAHLIIDYKAGKKGSIEFQQNGITLNTITSDGTDLNVETVAGDINFKLETGKKMLAEIGTKKKTIAFEEDRLAQVGDLDAFLKQTKDPADKDENTLAKALVVMKTEFDEATKVPPSMSIGDWTGTIKCKIVSGTPGHVLADAGNIEPNSNLEHPDEIDLEDGTEQYVKFVWDGGDPTTMPDDLLPVKFLGSSGSPVLLYTNTSKTQNAVFSALKSWINFDASVKVVKIGSDWFLKDVYVPADMKGKVVHLLNDGTVSMDKSYIPTHDQEIATVQFVNKRIASGGLRFATEQQVDAKVAEDVVLNPKALKYFDKGLVKNDEVVRIGNNAGEKNQEGHAIAIGAGSGHEAQGENAIALGYSAGATNQGAGSIAIGHNAGVNDQKPGSIIISANEGRGSTGVMTDDILIETEKAAVKFESGNKTFAFTNSTNDAIMTLNGLPILGGGDLDAVKKQIKGINYKGGKTEVAEGVTLKKPQKLGTGDLSASSELITVGNAYLMNKASVQTDGQSEMIPNYKPSKNLHVATKEYVDAHTPKDSFNSKTDEIKLGSLAGDKTQGSSAIAIGKSAGENNQGADSIAIGVSAGSNDLGEGSIIIGKQTNALDTYEKNVVGIGVDVGSLVENEIKIKAGTTVISATSAGMEVENGLTVDGEKVLSGKDLKPITDQLTAYEYKKGAAIFENIKVKGVKASYEDNELMPKIKIQELMTSGQQGGVLLADGSVKLNANYVPSSNYEITNVKYVKDALDGKELGDETKGEVLRKKKAQMDSSYTPSGNYDVTTVKFTEEKIAAAITEQDLGDHTDGEVLRKKKAQMDISYTPSDNMDLTNKGFVESETKKVADKIQQVKIQLTESELTGKDVRGGMAILRQKLKEFESTTLPVSKTSTPELYRVLALDSSVGDFVLVDLTVSNKLIKFLGTVEDGRIFKMVYKGTEAATSGWSELGAGGGGTTPSGPGELVKMGKFTIKAGTKANQVVIFAINWKPTTSVPIFKLRDEDEFGGVYEFRSHLASGDSDSLIQPLSIRFNNKKISSIMLNWTAPRGFHWAVQPSADVTKDVVYDVYVESMIMKSQSTFKITSIVENKVTSFGAPVSQIDVSKAYPTSKMIENTIEEGQHTKNEPIDPTKTPESDMYGTHVHFKKGSVLRMSGFMTCSRNANVPTIQIFHGSTQLSMYAAQTYIGKVSYERGQYGFNPWDIASNKYSIGLVPTYKGYFPMAANTYTYVELTLDNRNKNALLVKTKMIYHSNSSHKSEAFTLSVFAIGSKTEDFSVSFSSLFAGSQAVKYYLFKD